MLRRRPEPSQGGGFARLVLGVALLLAAIGWLFWNEGRAVATERALDEGAGAVVSIDPGRVDPQNQGRLVHFSGPLAHRHVPADDLFPGLDVPPNTVRLVRSVAMYQWREHVRNKSDISYSREWSDTAVDSSRFADPFGYPNPPMPLEGRSFAIPLDSIGAFILDGKGLSALGPALSLPLREADAQAVAQRMRAAGKVHLNGNQLYIGDNPVMPAVGDLRISFAVARLDTASVVGRQDGDRLVPHAASNANEIYLLQEGQVSAGGMFATAHSANTFATWMIRILGLLAMMAGFRLILGLGDALPLVGGLLGAAANLVSAALTAVVGAGVIGLGWLVYRPAAGLVVIAAGLVLGVILARTGRSRQTGRLHP